MSKLQGSLSCRFPLLVEKNLKRSKIEKERKPKWTELAVKSSWKKQISGDGGEVAFWILNDVKLDSWGFDSKPINEVKVKLTKTITPWNAHLQRTCHQPWQLCLRSRPMLADQLTNAAHQTSTPGHLSSTFLSCWQISQKWGLTHEAQKNSL